MTAKISSAGTGRTSVYSCLRSVNACLDEFRSGKLPNILIPLWRLRVVHDQSRIEGYAGVAQLCSRAEANLILLEANQGQLTEDLVRDTRELLTRIGQSVNGYPAKLRALPTYPPPAKISLMNSQWAPTVRI